MLRVLIFASALVVASLPAATASDSEALPAWLEAQLMARGIVADPADVLIERTVLADGAVTRTTVPLRSLSQDDPFKGMRVASPGAGDVLVGQLTSHLMLQVGRCDGYAAQIAAPGITLVQDATWDLGLHLALGPAAGGVAVSTAGDPQSNLLLIQSADAGMTIAAGDLIITEDRLTIFGICIGTLGTMTGTGVWQFA